MAEREFSGMHHNSHLILYLSFYDYVGIDQSTVYFIEEFYLDDGTIISRRTIRAFV